jgi:trehalose 6-phosphate synthase
VLILSRFAGAAEELDAALIVNPYDIPATAEVIRTALEMSPEERRERHKAMLGVVATHDIGAWCRSFLAALTRVSAVDSPALLTPTEAISRALEKLRQSSGAPPAAA